MSAFLRSPLALFLLLAAHSAEAQDQRSFEKRLDTLLASPKFAPTFLYAGANRDDKTELTRIVNQAIADVRSLPTPRKIEQVRGRLKRLVKDTDPFDTEDRDRADKYAIEIWRAAGFTQESGLLPVPDARIMGLPILR